MAEDSIFRLGAGQTIAPAGASAASTAFANTTFYIRVCTTAAVNFRIDSGTPTAVATDALLAPNIPEYFAVSPGQKLAAIGTATVSITECS